MMHGHQLKQSKFPYLLGFFFKEVMLFGYMIKVLRTITSFVYKVIFHENDRMVNNNFSALWYLTLIYEIGPLSSSYLRVWSNVAMTMFRTVRYYYGNEAMLYPAIGIAPALSRHCTIDFFAHALFLRKWRQMILFIN